MPRQPVPDLVRVRFKVIRLEKTPAGSFARASDSVRAVREVLRGHGVPDGGVERSRLGLKSAWSYTGSRREFLGYECTAASAVQSGDLDDVQQLLVDLVDAGANEIEGVDFDVAGKPAIISKPEPPRHLHARSYADRVGTVPANWTGNSVTSISLTGGSTRFFLTRPRPPAAA